MVVLNKLCVSCHSYRVLEIILRKNDENGLKYFKMHSFRLYGLVGINDHPLSKVNSEMKYKLLTSNQNRELNRPLP